MTISGAEREEVRVADVNNAVSDRGRRDDVGLPWEISAPDLFASDPIECEDRTFARDKD